MIHPRCLRSRPTAEIRVENAARRDQVNRCIDNNAQQEEAFHGFLKLLGAHGGKMPYGAVDKLVRSYHFNSSKAINLIKISIIVSRISLVNAMVMILQYELCNPRVT